MEYELEEKHTPKNNLIDRFSLESIHSNQDGNSHIPYTEYENSQLELPFNSFFPTYYFKYRYKFLKIFSCRVCNTNIQLGTFLFFILMSLCFIFGNYYIETYMNTSKEKRKATGSLSSISLGLAVTFASRNSIWTIIAGIPFERGLFWHKFFSYWGLILGIFHGCLEFPRWKKRDISGICLCSFIFVSAITSFYLIRRKSFQFFLITHWILITCVVISAIIHEAGEIVIGFALFGFDLFLRYIIIKRNKNDIQTVSLMKLPSKVLRIVFNGTKKFCYKPGQYVFLCFPHISLYEFHPFSISSSPHEENTHIHIRVLGDWTQKLYDSTNKLVENFECFIDGPYGNPMINIDNQEIKVFIMISGGIGITPLQSICNELLNQKNRGRALKKILFIWSVKDINYINEGFIDGLPKSLPISFQPDLLNEKNNDVLISWFHLTTYRKESEYYKDNIHPFKQKNLKMGRPDLRNYMREIESIALKENENKVGVLCCGPEIMIQEVRNLSTEFSKRRVCFEFHEEIFEF